MYVKPTMQHLTVKDGGYAQGHPLPIWELHDLPVPDVNLFSNRTDVLLPGQEFLVKDITRPHRYMLVPNEETKTEFKNQHDVFVNAIAQCLLEIQKQQQYTYNIAELPKSTDLSILANNTDNISTGIHYIGDQAGCGMTWHLDNRLLIGTMIINLQDNENSTEFALSVDADQPIYQAPTKRGTGVFWFDTYATWHRIVNTADRRVSYMNVAVCSVHQ